MAHWSEALIPIFLDSSLRILLIAAGIAAMLALLRMRSSSLQHNMWTAVLFVMLLMPVLPYCVPAISIPGRISSLPGLPIPAAIAENVTYSTTARSVTIQSPQIQAPKASPAAVAITADVPNDVPATSLSWSRMLSLLYLIVLSALSIYLAAGWITMRRVLRQSSRLFPAGCPSIVESSSVASPVTMGIVRATIVLPSGWRSWPHAKRRAILAHEIAHIRRRDPLFRFFAQVNCCLFWFNPLSWWLKRKLAATAEHTCDETAIRVLGQPRLYAEMLLEIAESVRERGCRLSMQGIGIHGNGLMASRIDRILQLDEFPAVSKKRKLIVALVAVMLVFVVVACRRQSAPSFEKDRQVLATFVADPVHKQDPTTRQILENSASSRYAERITPSEVAQLDSRIAQHPDDTAMERKRLLYFYSWQIQNGKLANPQSVTAARRRQILWLIAHRPDDTFLSSSPASSIFSDESIPASDPSGHQEARKLWIAQTEKKDVALQTLLNAVHFFQAEEKPLAEQVLFRAKSALSSEEWNNRITQLYVLTLLDITDASEFLLLESGKPPQTFRIPELPDKIAHTPFAEEVRKKLAESNDAHLLTSVGINLVGIFYRPKLSNKTTEAAAVARSYFERAIQVDPASSEARKILAGIHSGEIAERIRALPPGDNRYPAVAALPDRVRFEMLWELASERYYYGRAFDVSQRDFKLREFEKSRKYAADLVQLAPEFSSDPRYGNALQNGNLLLAYFAAEKGERGPAVQYLRAAASAPASDAIEVPWRILCNDLLNLGEKDAVIDFLERVAQNHPAEQFEKKQMLAIAARLRNGQNPIWNSVNY